jgi:hypothetical protein
MFAEYQCGGHSSPCKNKLPPFCDRLQGQIVIQFYMFIPAIGQNVILSYSWSLQNDLEIIHEIKGRAGIDASAKDFLV